MYTTTAQHLQQITETLLREMIDEYTESAYACGGAISSDAYNTAWVAMVRDPLNHEQLAFPRAMNWLLRHQAQDGSWGEISPYSLLSTLAALLSLLKAPDYYHQDTHFAILRATDYLRYHLNHWSVNTHESVGFEILVPSLLAQLETAGINLNFFARDDLMRLSQEKLSLAPLEIMYSGTSTLIHSLEAFGPYLDIPRLKRLQSAYGSYTYSPAATAAILIYGNEWDPDAAAWLAHLSEWGIGEDQGAMPSAYPLDVFEASWVLYNLAQGNTTLLYNFPQSQGVLSKLLSWLEVSLTPQGASISRYPAMPYDADDTALAMATLHLFNREVPLDALVPFERISHFACYEQERVRSISVNAHVLDVLLTAPRQVKRGRENWVSQNIKKTVDFLYQKRDRQGFWEDKWHVSPYYATASCVLALAKHPDQTIHTELNRTISWVLDSQSSKDGGWGKYGKAETRTTMEETAYALQILRAAYWMRDDDSQHIHQAIERGITYLWQQLMSPQMTIAGQAPSYELLWCDKTLYVPTRIVTSVILSVLSSHSISPCFQGNFDER